MIEIVKSDTSLKLKIPSSMVHIGGVITTFSGFMRFHKVSEESINQAIIVLRELLINAMGHGNRYKAMAPVSIIVDRLDVKRFRIMVRDVGGGFDYESIDTSIPENPKAIKQRGYRLIKAFSDSFEFNKKGNRVTAYISTE